MYPTVSEQITALKRVLKDVVRPAISNEYAQNVLYFTVRMLNSLAVEVVAAHPANVREIALLSQLFRELLPELRHRGPQGDIDPSLLRELEELADVKLEDPADLEAAQRLVSRMRDAAAAVIRRLAFRPGADASSAAIRRYVEGLCDLQATLFKSGK
jgi:hypothetical protein